MIEKLDKSNLETVGKILSQHRKSMGLSLDKISKDTKIQKKYLKALEQGDCEVLRFSAYYFGYLKSYAAILNLNYHELHELFSSSNDNNKIKAPRSENLIASKDFNPHILILAASFIATILIMIALN